MEPGVADVDALEHLDDGDLAARAPEDFEAFAELYRRHLCPVYRFVSSQIPDVGSAEDVTAQVFFRALSSAASFRGDGSYRSWLFRIAHNSVLTWRSRQNSSHVIVLDDVPDREDPDPSPASQAILGEARDAVRRKVAELPPAQREVVALRYLEDFSIEEIAAITRRTRGAVRILLHRARNRLRRSLEGKEGS